MNHWQGKPAPAWKKAEIAFDVYVSRHGWYPTVIWSELFSELGKQRRLAGIKL